MMNSPPPVIPASAPPKQPTQAEIEAELRARAKKEAARVSANDLRIDPGAPNGGSTGLIIPTS